LVLLDLMQQYHWKARRASQCVPRHARLAWLEKLDTEERGLWVSSFQDSNSTLGAVVARSCASETRLGFHQHSDAQE